MTQTIRKIMEELKAMVADDHVITRSAELNEEYCIYEYANREEYNEEEYDENEKEYNDDEEEYDGEEYEEEEYRRCFESVIGKVIWDKELREAIEGMMKSLVDDYFISYGVENVIVTRDRIYVNYVVIIRSSFGYDAAIYYYRTKTLEEIVKAFEEEKQRRVLNIEELKKKFEELIEEYLTTSS